MKSLRALRMAALLAGLAGVGQAGVTVTLTADPPGPITYGQQVTLTAFINGDANCAGQRVVFFDLAGPSPGQATTTQAFGHPGECTAAVTPNNLPSGQDELWAEYDLGTYYGPFSNHISLTVYRAAPSISFTSTPNPSSFGQTVTLTATVGPQFGGATVPTGNVYFWDGTTRIATVTLNAAGVASATTSVLPAGTDSLKAVYVGDGNYEGSNSNTVSQVVNYRNTTSIGLVTSPNPSTVGQTVLLQAELNPVMLPPLIGPTGTVTFYDGSTQITSATLTVVGIAVATTSTLTPGTHSLTASYIGDSNFQGSSSNKVSQVVNQLPTATSLQVTPSSCKLGQNVTLTATVSPSTATGTVSFLDGPTTIGTAGLNAGTASFNISTLASGNHSLTASYGGDANDAPSASSPPVVVSVGLEPTTTTLSAKPNPGTVGQNVTLTATVSPGTATGTVSFYDGTNLLGTTAMAGGIAAFSTPTLTAGNHSLTATYSGDSNNATSTSAAVVESVTGTSTAAPNPVSVSPAWGTAWSQVMTFTFNDPDGWQDLDVVNILINNFLDGRNACYLAYSRTAGVLYLVKDDGGTLSTGLVLGGAGSLSNSQCSVAGAASSASGSGNTLTVTLNMNFTASFAGNKVVYLAARSVGGGNSGWQALGVWCLPFAPTSTIAVGSLTQERSAAPAGTAQTFVATLTDSQGVSDFGIVNLLANNFIDGRNACYLAYVASTNSLLLVDDGGDAGGPFAGSMVLNGGAASIQNSQCSVNGVGSSAVKSGNTLTLTLNLTLKSPLGGNRVVWVAGRDGAGANNTDWQAMGTTTVQ